MAELQIMLGLVLQFLNISGLSSNTILSLYQEVASFLSHDWKDIWKSSLESINLEYFEDIQGIIHKKLMKYSEIVDWVKSITLQQYVIDWSKEEEEEGGRGGGEGFLGDIKYVDDVENWAYEMKEDLDKLNKVEIEEARERSRNKNTWLDRKVKEHFGIDQREIKRSLSPQRNEIKLQEENKMEGNKKGKAVASKSKEKEKKKPEEKPKKKRFGFF